MPKHEPESLKWKVHTPNLLGELLNNRGAEMLYRPIQITANLLDQVAQRASQLNDPILNHLMCKLTLYEIADPTKPDYDLTKITAIAAKAEKLMERV